MRKAILLISRHAPYGNKLAKEALDAAMVCAAYDQDLSLLFRDDGVLQLVKDQAAQKIQQKKFSSLIQSLEFYDLTNIFVDQASLDERGLSKQDLVLDSMRTLNQIEINALVAKQDHILSY